jgi:hypothetical protein
LRKRINTRAFISATLFILLIIIFVTAVAVQILDEMIDPKILIFLYLNPQSEPIV